METTNDKSPITLKNYVAVLEDAAHGRLASMDSLRQTPNWRIAKELMNEGLISDGLVEFSSGPGVVSDTVITPSGAIALEGWKSYLREESIWYKLKDNIGRLFWLLVGALLVSALDIYELIKTSMSQS